MTGEVSSGTLQALCEFLDELEGAQGLYAPACEKITGHGMVIAL